MNSPPQRTGAGAAALLGLLLVAGCDVPTVLPWWETRWVVPAETARVGAGSFLPEGITVADDSATFNLRVEPFLADGDLAELCAACVLLDGLTAPKPAFEATIEALGPFPEELEEALLEEGGVAVELHNGLSFDPIRPGADTGAIEVRIRNGEDGGRSLVDTVISGAVEEFAPGTVKVLDLPVEPGTIRGGLVAEVRIHSPHGDPAEIRIEERLRARFRPGTFRLESARVQVAGLLVVLSPTELDVEDLDGQVVERVMDGAVEVTVENPLGLTLDLDLRIGGPQTPELVRELSIPPGGQVTRLPFSGDELRSFLGKPGVLLQGSGLVRAGAPPVTLQPGLEVTLQVTLDLVLRMGAGS